MFEIIIDLRGNGCECILHKTNGLNQNMCGSN